MKMHQLLCLMSYNSFNIMSMHVLMAFQSHKPFRERAGLIIACGNVSPCMALLKASDHLMLRQLRWFGAARTWQPTIIEIQLHVRRPHFVPFEWNWETVLVIRKLLANWPVGSSGPFKLNLQMCILTPSSRVLRTKKVKLHPLVHLLNALFWSTHI